jgi:outer membrane protein
MNKSYLPKSAMLILSTVAIIALLSTGCKKTQGTAIGSSTKSSGIVYVELDSVIAHFAMATDKQTELMGKQKNSEAELNTKSQAFDRDVRDYQTKAQKGLITRATAAEIEQTLGQQQQDLISLRDKLAGTLNEESVVAQRQILEYINLYLVEYNKDHSYQYILAKQFPGQVLYSDPSLDITASVIEGINAKYKAEKK